jgi:hypothetical protein
MQNTFTLDVINSRNKGYQEQDEGNSQETKWKGKAKSDAARDKPERACICFCVGPWPGRQVCGATVPSKDLATWAKHE